MPTDLCFEKTVKPFMREQLTTFIGKVLHRKTYANDQVFTDVCMQIVIHGTEKEKWSLRKVFGWNSISELVSWSESKNLPTSSKVRELLLREMMLLMSL